MMRSSASSVSPAPIRRAVSMNRSNCGFSSGDGGLRAGMVASSYKGCRRSVPLARLAAGNICGKSLGAAFRSHEGTGVTDNCSQPTKPERLLCWESRGGDNEKLPLIGVAVICGAPQQTVPCEDIHMGWPSRLLGPHRPGRVKPPCPRSDIKNARTALRRHLRCRLFGWVPCLPSCRLLQFEPSAKFMLEVPSGPIVANMSPPAAREIWLDHSFDEGDSVLILNERLVKKTRRQSHGNFIHLDSLPLSLEGRGFCPDATSRSVSQ